MSDSIKPVTFKPYETKSPKSVVSVSPNGSQKSSTSPKINGHHHQKSSSPASPNHNTKDRIVSTTTSSSSSSTSPVIRSGIEVLSQSFRLPPTTSAASSDNPAFRPPFGGSGSHHHHHLANLTCRDPYCRDPTCPTALYNAQLAAASLAMLPPGYAELIQAQKQQAAAAAAAVAAATVTAASPAVTTASSSLTRGSEGPYICNWVNTRDGYCGKRHNSAEELLTHLRTHTNLSTTDSAALLSSSLYPPPSLMHPRTTYPTALSSLSSSRFHPYAKPSGALTPGLGGLGGLPPPLPPALTGLGAYTPSLYASLYGSRLTGGSLP